MEPTEKNPVESLHPQSAAPDPAAKGSEKPKKTRPTELPEINEPSPDDKWKSLFFKVLPLMIVLVVGAILLTYTLTTAAERNRYVKALLSDSPKSVSVEQDAENLKILEGILNRYSYYSNSLDSEAMLQAAFRAYVRQSGDLYAEYYTEEEYLAMSQSTAGQFVGVGVTVRSEYLTFEGAERLLMLIFQVTKNSPAEKAGILPGDRIAAIRGDDGAMRTVDQLGYEQAMNAVRGEIGTSVELLILREKANGEFDSLNITVKRDRFETVTADGYVCEADPTVAIVRITEFELNTPVQFCRTVDHFREQGIRKFVFDLRENPGGDLRSISAVLSNFLQKGDLVISTIDKNGKTAATVNVEPISLAGDAAGCSISEEQIGQYRDLSFTVLCDRNTASAAEVFVATMRDYGLAREIVGNTTFGKGIMQSILPIPFQGIKGYIRLTTYAYVTKCGVSYHGVGITPGIEVARKAGTEQLPAAGLSWEDDAQLQTAVQTLS